MSEKQCKRAGIYIAPSAYGWPVDREEALASCKSFVRKSPSLGLTRIYCDEQVSVIRTPEQNGRRKPLGVTGNDAWQRLLRDTETSAIEAVVIYAARTVAPSISGLKTILLEYFLPFGIRFIDVEAGFDLETGDLDVYLKARTREFRSTLYGKKATE
ncbi:MAG: hypothetical protein LUC38_07735 [Oscillospiraceae bacterium]|nr:hypothetical protein [Ruminococcus sp.]MCD8345828.1 hypothetical protein [Oscillospiraceae bacterium]